MPSKEITEGDDVVASKEMDEVEAPGDEDSSGKNLSALTGEIPSDDDLDMDRTMSQMDLTFINQPEAKKAKVDGEALSEAQKVNSSRVD